MQIPIQQQTFKSTLASIPDGKDGILATLMLMKQLAKDYRKNIVIRSLAVELSKNYQQKDYVGEVKALQAFVRDKIRYIKDVRDVETIQTPLVTLQIRSGDCDDKCTLLASLLESIGHPTRYVAVGFQPDNFEHVLCETRIGNKWIPLECTEPVNIGWQPSHIQARMVVHI